MPRSPGLKFCLALLLFACPPVAPAERPKTLEESDLSQFRVRDLLKIRVRVASNELVRRGIKAFPDYEAILADKETQPNHIAQIFYILCEVKGDRSRFVKYAVRGLKCHDAEARGQAKFKGAPDEAKRDLWRQEDSGVRLWAVELLAAIGSTKEAPEVYKLVFDDDSAVQFAAVEATGAIGGPAEFENLERILNNTRPTRYNIDWLAHVKKHRDRLKKRLNAIKKAKAGPQPEP